MAACAPCRPRSARDVGTRTAGPFLEIRRRAAEVGTIRDAGVAAYVLEPMADEVQEIAVVLGLNVHAQMQDVVEVARGAVEHVDISLPLAIRALAKMASYWGILAHNHPSGSAEPSAADARLWHDARKQFACAGLLLMDHLVIARREFFSFAWGARYRLRG